MGTYQRNRLETIKSKKRKYEMVIMPDTANEVFFHFDLIQDLQEKETFSV